MGLTAEFDEYAEANAEEKPCSANFANSAVKLFVVFASSHAPHGAE
jgi:hypothetical protein